MRPHLGKSCVALSPTDGGRLTIYRCEPLSCYFEGLWVVWPLQWNSYLLSNCAFFNMYRIRLYILPPPTPPHKCPQVNNPSIHACTRNFNRFNFKWKYRRCYYLINYFNVMADIIKINTNSRVTKVVVKYFWYNYIN